MGVVFAAFFCLVCLSLLLGRMRIGIYSHMPFATLSEYSHLIPGNEPPFAEFFCEYQFYPAYGYTQYYYCVIDLPENPYFRQLSYSGNADEITTLALHTRGDNVRLGHAMRYLGTPDRMRKYKAASGSVLHWVWGSYRGTAVYTHAVEDDDMEPFTALRVVRFGLDSSGALNEMISP